MLRGAGVRTLASGAESQLDAGGERPRPWSNDQSERGFLRGLQSYGDRDFSIYMRRAFAKSMGYSGDELGAPRGRHRLHALPLQPLPPPLPRAARRGEARRGGGGRAGARVPHHLAARIHAGAQLHEVPQPHGHGHRGDDPRPAHGRGGADGRLRQDRAGAADGRRQRRQAGDPADRRPADDLALQGRPRRRLHRLPQVLDPVPRRQARQGRDRGGGGPPRHHRRHLRRDGHRLHHGGHRRGAGHDAARHRRHSRRARRPPARRRGDRRARRGAGALRSDAGQDHHRRRRSRTPRACCWRSAAPPTA